jgi:hypothetical protein
MAATTQHRRPGMQHRRHWRRHRRQGTQYRQPGTPPQALLPHRQWHRGASWLKVRRRRHGRPAAAAAGRQHRLHRRQRPLHRVHLRQHLQHRLPGTPHRQPGTPPPALLPLRRRHRGAAQLKVRRRRHGRPVAAAAGRQHRQHLRPSELPAFISDVQHARFSFSGVILLLRLLRILQTTLGLLFVESCVGGAGPRAVLSLAALSPQASVDCTQLGGEHVELVRQLLEADRFLHPHQLVRNVPRVFARRAVPTILVSWTALAQHGALSCHIGSKPEV